MSMETVTTGSIAAPELKYTQGGKAVLELRIAATRRAKNQQTGEWTDDGGALWVSATFWEKEAETLAETLTKGSKVTVSGTVVMEEYQKRDGTQGQKIVVRFPKFLGVVPKTPQNGTQWGAGATSGASPVQTTSSDPWGAPGAGGGFDMENSGTYETERAPF